MPVPCSESWERLVQLGRLPAPEAVRLPHVSLDDGRGEGSPLQWWLEAMTLPHAIGVILDDIQDWVIDEVWGAWPACPGHGRPMEPVCGNWDSPDAIVYWACPTTREKITPVGSLTRSSGQSATEN